MVPAADKGPVIGSQLQRLHLMDGCARPYETRDGGNAGGFSRF